MSEIIWIMSEYNNNDIIFYLKLFFIADILLPAFVLI